MTAAIGHRNKELTSDMFETTPRDGDVLSIKRCETSDGSVASFLYPRMPGNALSFEVTGPLWLFGVTVFKCKSPQQYMAVRVLVKATEGRTLRTVEKVEFCKTESDSNTMDITLHDPLRLVPNTKYILHLVLFCSAEDRALYGPLNTEGTLEFCRETITFSNCRDGQFILPSASIAGLLLQGMKEIDVDDDNDDDNNGDDDDDDD